jgi:hypothetical protein
MKRTSQRSHLIRLPAFAVALIGAVLQTGPLNAALVFEKQDLQTEMSALQSECVTRFVFRNGGSSPIKITSLRSTCSCTTPELKKLNYAPEEAGEIVIRFEPGDRHGVQRQGIVIKTDDPEQPHVVLSFTAVIPKVMSFSPQVLLWKEGEATETKTLTATVAAGIEVRELRALAGSNRLGVEVERTSSSTFAVKVTPAADVRNLFEALQVDAILDGGKIKRSAAYVRVR